MKTDRLLFTPRPRLATMARHVLTLILLAFLLYPLFVLLSASVSVGGTTGGGTFTWDNFVNGWLGVGSLGFDTYFRNSLLVSALSIVGVLFSCTFAAYAFAKLRFPGRRVLFALVIATLLLPAQVTIVPQYIMFNSLGMVDTLWPLLLPRYLGVDAFYTFLLVQFIRGISPSLSEAALVDGAGHFGVFWRIIVPLSLPALATTAIFCFIHTWNDFLTPLLYLNNPQSFTVALGLSQFLDATGNSNIGGLMAMATLSLVPLIVFFLLAQRHITDGISTTGLK